MNPTMQPDRSAIFRGVFAVGTMLAAVLMYCQWIGPLKKRANDSQRRLVELRENLEPARETIQRVRTLEQKTAQARRELQGLKGDHPKGSALVWLPERAKEHFKQFGIAVTVIRLNTVQDEAGLPGYRRAYWGIGLPIENGEKSVNGLLLAVEQLERQNRFVRVIDFAIRPDVENPLLRTAAINIVALVQE
jgi:hypothetical protein